MHQIEPITSSRKSTPKEKKETLTKKSESHLANCQKPLLFHSQWNVNLFNKQKTCLILKETTLFSSDRQYPFQPIMKDKWVNCTAN